MKCIVYSLIVKDGSQANFMQCINQSIESYHEKKAHQFAILESARAICRLEYEIRCRLKNKTLRDMLRVKQAHLLLCPEFTNIVHFDSFWPTLSRTADFNLIFRFITRVGRLRVLKCVWFVFICRRGVELLIGSCPLITRPDWFAQS